MTANPGWAVAAWFAYVALFAYAMWRKLNQRAPVDYPMAFIIMTLFGALCALALGTFGRFWEVAGFLFGPMLGAHLLEREYEGRS